MRARGKTEIERPDRLRTDEPVEPSTVIDPTVPSRARYSNRYHVREEGRRREDDAIELSSTLVARQQLSKVFVLLPDIGNTISPNWPIAIPVSVSYDTEPKRSCTAGA